MAAERRYEIGREAGEALEEWKKVMSKQDHSGDNELVMIQAITNIGRHRVQLTNALLARLKIPFIANPWLVKCLTSEAPNLGRNISWNFWKIQACGACCILVALNQLLILLL